MQLCQRPTDLQTHDCNALWTSTDQPHLPSSTEGGHKHAVYIGNCTAHTVEAKTKCIQPEAEQIYSFQAGGNVDLSLYKRTHAITNSSKLLHLQICWSSFGYKVFLDGIHILS